MIIDRVRFQKRTTGHAHGSPHDNPVGVVPKKKRARSSISRVIRAKGIRGVMTFIVIGIIWQIVGMKKVYPLAIPSLTTIASEYKRLWEDGTLKTDTWTTFQEFGIGFAVAIVVGIVIGILLGVSSVLRDFIDPLINALNSTPMIALAPIFILMLGVQAAPKIAMVFLLSVFPIIINTTAGIRSTDQVYVDVGKAFCASRMQIFSKVLLPSALPVILTGLRLGVSRGLVAAVAAELFGSSAGLGYLVVVSSQVFDASGAWVGVITLAAIGVVLTGLIRRVETSVLANRGKAVM